MDTLTLCLGVAVFIQFVINCCFFYFARLLYRQQVQYNDILIENQQKLNIVVNSLLESLK